MLADAYGLVNVSELSTFGKAVCIVVMLVASLVFTILVIGVIGAIIDKAPAAAKKLPREVSKAVKYVKDEWKKGQEG